MNRLSSRIARVHSLFVAGALCAAAVARAQAVPQPEAQAAKPGSVHKERGFDYGFEGTVLGASDSNVLDKGQNPIAAGGLDVDLALHIGVPLGERVGWQAAVTYGTNYRDGGDPGSNALKIDGGFKTGIEAVVFGRSSVPGRKAKSPLFPAIRIGADFKYGLTATPLLQEKKTQYDETADSLEATDDAADSGESGGDGGGEDEASAASVSSGGQTFSNPNVHHKVTGIVRAAIDVTKLLTIAADFTGGRDIVQLEEQADPTVPAPTSPQYNDLGSGLTIKYKLAPKFLWLSAGYTFEQRYYDEQKAKNGQTLAFDVHGAKLGIDVPLKRVKIKLAYDLKFKLVGVDETMNTTRHQVQLAAEISVLKSLAVVLDTRFTDTAASAGPDSIRFIGMAGLRVKL